MTLTPEDLMAELIEEHTPSLAEAVRQLLLTGTVTFTVDGTSEPATVEPLPNPTFGNPLREPGASWDDDLSDWEPDLIHESAFRREYLNHWSVSTYRADMRPMETPPTHRFDNNGRAPFCSPSRGSFFERYQAGRRACEESANEIRASLTFGSPRKPVSKPIEEPEEN